MLDLSSQLSKYPFNKNSLKLIDSDEYVSQKFPIVYILFDETKMLAYVGESADANRRLLTHLSNKEKKQLKLFYIISNQLLNKSAALDIEANLIQYMPSLGFKLLNGNIGTSTRNYYQKDIYQKVFEQLWSQLTFSNIPLQSLNTIKNSDIFKYSPYKTLNHDQYNSILEILGNLINGNSTTIFAEGLAGTGKTILAIYIIKLLSHYNQYDEHELDGIDPLFRELIIAFKEKFPTGLKIGFVVPMTSLRRTLGSVFKEIYGLSKSMVIGPSDVIKKPYDLLIIDEAHRLTRRLAITNVGAFDNTNKKLGLYPGKDNKDPTVHGTQLDWIMKSSTYQIFFYDPEQSIKPADIRKGDFNKIKSLPATKTTILTTQMRALGGNDYIDFVHKLLNQKLKRPVKKFSHQDYELIMFDHVENMVKQLRKREAEYGLCRIMAGYSWPWSSKDKDGIVDVTIDGVDLTWNKQHLEWINSTTDMTEMGCIHTTQGYDLNYAGVIFGEEIDYDKTSKKIVIDKAKYFDTKAKTSLESDQEPHDYIIRIYKTMMYRGIRGTYIYICNPSLRDYFSQFISGYDLLTP